MNEIKAIGEKIREADAVLIGASNGLSITEGLHLFADNQAFEDLFGDLKKKYGLRCILQGMGAGWPSEEEKWGFWSRLVRHYCGNYQETQVMADLKKVIGEKDYFVVTSNGECHFELCGFVPEKIYEIEGNWLTMQCAARCHERIYPWADLAKKMAAEETGGKIPSALVPACPVCGGPMQVHMEMDQNFISGYKRAEASDRFSGTVSGEEAGDFGTGGRLAKPADQSAADEADGKRTPGFLCNGKFGRDIYSG